MAHFAYVNGSFLPHNQAGVSIEDRGYQFGDGVYEVVGWYNFKPLDMERHLDRLAYSLNELEIKPPMARKVLEAKIHQLARLNGLKEGLVYLQVTRGVAKRNHAYPHPAPRPAIVIATMRGSLWGGDRIKKGIKAITVPDIRWHRCDIKTVSLIANCMAKQAAVQQKAGEAIFVNAVGDITEGASSTIWIINQQNELISHPVTGGKILPGITRKSLTEMISQAGLSLIERPFSLEEAYQAQELFLSAASSLMIPIVQLNDQKINDGKPGAKTEKLRNLYYQRFMQAQE